MDRRAFVHTAALTAMNLQTLDQLTAAQPKAERQPAIFIGHGSPMNIIRDNSFTRSLAELGRRHGKPGSALVVSAHWLTQNETSVSVNPKPPTVHDFGGFPEELYRIEYPAPGSPVAAHEAAVEVSSIKVHEDHEMGLDHGAWSILRHIWPEADVPVFQMSIDYARPPQFHYDLGKELRRLRDRGVLIIGSGNIVHNLRRLSPQENDPKHMDWAVEFDDWAGQRLAGNDHSALIHYDQQGTVARLAVPTNDHYLPMLYTLGALHEDEHIRFTHESFQHGSISMRCFESLSQN